MFLNYEVPTDLTLRETTHSKESMQLQKKPKLQIEENTELC